ncbi:MAG: hypothetical protein ACI8Q2_000292, partial [Candidatus Omnitrophota bacterium]
MSRRIEVILEYWFENITDDTPARFKESPFSKWFFAGEAVDALLRDTFGEDLKKAREGIYDTWLTTARGSLAFIVLADQFSRNIHRDKPEAFDIDTRAQEVAVQTIEKGFENELSCIERVFLYMPLMHAENLELQNKCVECFQRLVNDSKEICPDNTSYFANNLKYARDHRSDIEEHGRFIYRDEVLGRGNK